MLYKKLLLILSLWLYNSILFGQTDSRDTLNRDNKTPLKHRIELGGNFGLQFGQVTLIDVSPLIGYRLTEHITIGVGGSYMYFNDRYYQMKSTILGGRAFGRYYIVKNIFLHAEYEVLNGDWLYDSKRFNIESVFGGGGFSQRIGANSYFTLVVLWNFNDSYYSPYYNPIFRGGFTFGI